MNRGHRISIELFFEKFVLLLLLPLFLLPLSSLSRVVVCLSVYHPPESICQQATNQPLNNKYTYRRR